MSIAENLYAQQIGAPLEQLVDRAARLVRSAVARPGRFSSALRRFFPADMVGIADFMHCNPAMPSREAVGLVRLAAMNAAIAAEFGSGRIYNIVYDITRPSSEAGREGGGHGYVFGINRQTISVLDKETAFHRQQLAAVDVEATMAEFRRLIAERRPDLASDGTAGRRLSAARDLLERHNAQAGRNTPASVAIIDLKSETLRQLLGPAIETSHICLSRDHERLIAILDWLLRTGSLLQSVFEQTGAPIFAGRNARSAERAFFVRQGTLMDGEERDALDWAAAMEMLADGSLVPSVQLYLLTYVALPKFAHFGNLYDNHAAVQQAAATMLDADIGIVRLCGDGENGSPAGATMVRNRFGRRSRSLLTIDMMLDEPDVIARNIRTCATHGRCRAAERDFWQSFPGDARWR